MITQYFHRLLFFLLVFAAFLTSCEKDVTNINLPDTPAKLVVGCFISPQEDTLTVTLTRSVPLFGSGHTSSTNLQVTDASVIISDGTNSATVPYNSTNEKYELQSNLFPIASGQTYSLTISTPQGENISANCTVPPSNITSLTVDFVDTVSFYIKKITVKWQDIPNQTNYYRVVGQTVYADSWGWADTSYYNMYNPGNSSVQNDNEKKGQEMSSKLESNLSTNLAIVGYDIYLLNIDAGYYKYQYSLDHRGYDDPFSEPSPIYTNIEGGLGIFAAYQKFYARKI